MSGNYSLIIKNGTCYIDGKLTKVDLALSGNKIQKIGKIDLNSSKVFDATDKVVIPGIIDTQTHFREPGSTDVEELETLADCLGGSIGLDNQYTFKIAQETIDDFILVNEDKIAEGIKFNFVEHKLVTEGAAATGVMVVKDNMSNKLGNNIISLICGGNIDAKLFNKIIS